MLKSVAQNFEDYEFPTSLLECFGHILSMQKVDKDEKPVKLFDILMAILQETPHDSNQNKLACGITKNEIEKKFNISRHVSMEIFCLLTGASLIQWEARIEKGQFWTATCRGFQVAQYYKNYWRVNV